TERDIPGLLLDARQLIWTDDRFGSAEPLPDRTAAAFCELIPPYLERSAVPILQGFIGATPAGPAPTLRFEGSRFTATIAGACLGAEVVEIWKDVAGLMTADPALVAGAHTVPRCSFEEAAALTFFGAKVLHPKAIHPARRAGIPVEIFNSRSAEAGGT